MKYIVIGLGNFGSMLATKLTKMGNEVIGIDSDMQKVESHKESVTYTICLNATDQHTVAGLPLKDTDVVINAIGEDMGASILVTASLKNLNAKRIISRAINQLHVSILQAIGIDEIIHPEEESAARLARKLSLAGIVDSYELNRDFSIVEAALPKQYVGMTLEEIDFRRKYNILVLTTIKIDEVKKGFGIESKITTVKGIISPQTQLQADDILVLFGANKDINKFLKK